MLRLAHRGGERVRRGNYWNFGTGERITVVNHDVLPGDGAAIYYKVSPLAILAAGPLLGLAYAAFLPFIGIAAVLKFTMTKAAAGIVQTAARLSGFGWRPSEAYLSGKASKKVEDKKNDGGQETGHN
ncbi:MAG: hypothetical protein AB1553_04835 [Nitrospirota bacterium]